MLQLSVSLIHTHCIQRAVNYVVILTISEESLINLTGDYLETKRDHIWHGKDSSKNGHQPWTNARPQVTRVCIA